MQDKKVLAVYYSQSGQLKEITDNFCQPFIDAGIQVEKVRVSLKDEYPFPWTGKSFFSVMPDCLMGKSAELMPFTLKEESYDLIILGYQAWFLSSSIPFNGIIAHPAFRKVLANSPVITITGARNMWVNAFDMVKKKISEAGAKHVGTVALVDKHLNLLSIFTIFHWMLHGKKDRYLGFFPKPGVSENDILYTSALGSLAVPYLQKNEWLGLKETLIKNKAVVPKFHLMFIEKKAAVMFKIWARLIVRSKKRDRWLVAFKYYLLIALFIFSPIVFMIDLLVFKPFFPRYRRAAKEDCLKLNKYETLWN
ncbi:MAG: hypothetical protein ABJA78_02390 [Ferruginibacter sp.]